MGRWKLGAVSKCLTFLATISWIAIIGTLGAWERDTITTTHFIVQFAVAVLAAVVFGLAARRKEGKHR